MTKIILQSTIAFLIAIQITNAQTVTNYAGTGVSGFLNGSVTVAKFKQPCGITVDGSGNVYVADETNHKIRKIDTNGNVTTFAGSVSGYIDGAIGNTATSARFNDPSGVVFDSSGNMFVADFSNHRIRKIDTSGNVSTFAGSGTAGSNDGLANSAQFYNPFGIAIDGSNNLYLADQYNNRIRKITPAGEVSTLAGSTSGFADGSGTNAQFNQPTGVAVDASGNVYVADYYNHKIRKITQSGVVSTLAGSSQGYADATGINAKFDRPYGVVVDGSGNIYVTDTYNHKIRQISLTGVVTTLAGSTLGYADGEGTNAKFNYPIGIAITSNAKTIYIGDFENNRIRKIDISTLSTKDFEANATVGVYPNPVKDILNVEIGDVKTIEIYNVLGQKVASANQSSIETSNLKPGVYLVKVSLENGQSKTAKVVKE